MNESEYYERLIIAIETIAEKQEEIVDGLTMIETRLVQIREQIWESCS